MDSQINAVILDGGGNSQELAIKLSRFNIIPLNFIVTNDPSIIFSPTVGEMIPVISAVLNNYPNEPCLFINNTCNSSYSANAIYSFTEQALEPQLGQEVGIFQLALYDDRCDLNQYTESIFYRSTSLDIVTNKIITSFLAAVFSVSVMNDLITNYSPGIQLITALNDIILKRNILTISTIPSIFEYDFVAYAQDSASYQLVNRCGTTGDSTDTVSLQAYLSISVGVILLIMIGYGLYRIGPDTRREKK